MGKAQGLSGTDFGLLEVQGHLSQGNSLEKDWKSRSEGQTVEKPHVLLGEISHGGI